MLSNASVPHECFINSHWLFCSVGHGVANRPLVPLNAFIWFELSIVSSSTNTHINMDSPLPAVNLILIKTLVTSDSMKAQRIDWRNSFNTSLRSSTVASISTSICNLQLAFCILTNLISKRQTDRQAQPRTFLFLHFLSFRATLLVDITVFVYVFTHLVRFQWNASPAIIGFISRPIYFLSWLRSPSSVNSN